MTRKQFYLDLGKYIIEDLADKLSKPIKHFDLWNEQLAEDWGKKFSMPAIFLQFNPVPWESLGKNYQKTQLSFDLHIVQEVGTYTDYNNPLRDRNLEHLDLIDEIHYHLTGFRGEYFGSIHRTGSGLDQFHDKMTKHTETYECHFVTDTAVRKLEKKEGVNLEVESKFDQS